MLVHNAHQHAFLAAVKSGGLEAVKQHFESREVRETTARWNAAHHAKRLGEPGSSRWNCLWGAYVLDHGDVKVVRWLFGREQLDLLGETLRATAWYGLRRCLGETSAASAEILQVFLESPLFNEVMGHDERLEWLSVFLQSAVSRGSGRWVGVLLAYGADPNRESDSHTPLEVVLYMGNRETLNVLLANGAWLEGRDLLANHIIGKARSLVPDMVRRGADVNLILEMNGSALHYAATHCIRDAVISLMDEGFADIDARDHSGRTPLMVVGYEGWHLESDSDSDSDEAAPEYEITSLLVRAGVDVHAIDDERRGVLHYAVRRQCETCLSIILRRGADPNHRDTKGQTPLVALLAKEGIRLDGARKAVLALLLEAGANPFLEDHTGNSVSRLLDRSEIGRAFMREKRAFFRRQLPTVKRETKGQ